MQVNTNWGGIDPDDYEILDPLELKALLPCPGSKIDQLSELTEKIFNSAKKVGDSALKKIDSSVRQVTLFVEEFGVPGGIISGVALGTLLGGPIGGVVEGTRFYLVAQGSTIRAIETVRKTARLIHIGNNDANDAEDVDVDDEVNGDYEILRINGKSEISSIGEEYGFVEPNQQADQPFELSKIVSTSAKRAGCYALKAFDVGVHRMTLLINKIGLPTGLLLGGALGAAAGGPIGGLAGVRLVLVVRGTTRVVEDIRQTAQIISGHYLKSSQGDVIRIAESTEELPEEGLMGKYSGSFFQGGNLYTIHDD